jgi:MFS family permease
MDEANDSKSANRPAAGMPAGLPRTVKVLGWTSCLNDVASEMMYPLMPRFLISVLGGNRLHLGVIEGAAETASSLLKLWSGAWSDKSGQRKGIVVAGYAMAAVSRPLVGVVVAPWQLFAARIADRIGKGIRTSPRDALIAESTPPTMRGRAFGFHRSLDHLGAAVGPLLAAGFLWVWPLQLRLLFLLTLIPGLVVIGLLVMGLPADRRKGRGKGAEGHRDARPVPIRRSENTLPADSPLSREFRLYLAALLVFTVGNSSDAFLLVRADELGVPAYALPLLWFAFHSAKSAGNLLTGRLVDRLGPRRPLLLGWMIYALVYLAFGLATDPWHAWLCFLVYAAHYGLTEPAEKALVASFSGPHSMGLAFGWYNLAIGIAAFPSSLFFGAIYERFGPFAAFSWGAALAFVAMLLLAAVRAPSRPGSSHDKSLPVT